VALPAFNEEGDLPPGVYRATLSEVLKRFGQGRTQRRVMAGRLDRLYTLAASTGQLARFVISGRSSRQRPNPTTWTSSC
jgi:hypothetical protein